MVIRSCSWCHELNELRGTPTYCWSCGHRADVARISCDCPECSRARILTLFQRDGGARGA